LINKRRREDPRALTGAVPNDVRPSTPIGRYDDYSALFHEIGADGIMRIRERMR
jgi:hypothetical protein